MAAVGGAGDHTRAASWAAASVLALPKELHAETQLCPGALKKHRLREMGSSRRHHAASQWWCKLFMTRVR